MILIYLLLRHAITKIIIFPLFFMVYLSELPLITSIVGILLLVVLSLVTIKSTHWINLIIKQAIKYSCHKESQEVAILLCFVIAFIISDIGFALLFFDLTSLYSSIAFTFFLCLEIFFIEHDLLFSC